MLTVQELIDDWRPGTFDKISLECHIYWSPETGRSWIPASDHVGKDDEFEHSILIRCPGLTRALHGTPARKGVHRSNLCEVVGFRCQSNATPFPIILGPMCSLHYLAGEFRGRVAIESIPQILTEDVERLAEAPFVSGTSKEKTLFKWFEETQRW